MIFFKQFAVNFAVVIYHAQSALDRQIIVAEHVRPLQAEQQDHLGSPYADTLKRTECADCIRVAHVLHAFQIESAAAYLFGKSVMYSVLRKVMPSDCSRGTPAAVMLSAVTVLSASCMRCQMVACAFVEICCPMIWCTTEKTGRCPLFGQYGRAGR